MSVPIDAEADTGLYDTTDPSVGTAGSDAEPDTDPAEIVDAIQGIRAGDRERTDSLPAHKLPGFGRTQDDCGDPFPKFCASCGGVTMHSRRCRLSTCPECAPSWVLKRAREQGAKIGSYRALQDASSAAQWRYHHVVISPPRDLLVAAEDPLDRLFQAVGEIMSALDLQGVALYHPYRGKQEQDEFQAVVDELAADDTEPDEIDASHPLFGDEASGQAAWDALKDEVNEEPSSSGAGDDRGAWKRRLFKQRPWRSSDRNPELSGEPVRDELAFSPHFHVVGASPFVAGEGVTDVVYEETGWIIHRITPPDSTVSVYGDEELAAALTYCYSHVGLYETEQGRTQSAARLKGADIQDVSVYESTKLEWDHVTRAVATRTLGIPYAALACHEEDVDVDPADRQDGRVSASIASDPTTPTSAFGSSSSTELPATPSATELPASEDIDVGELGAADRDDLAGDGTPVDHAGDAADLRSTDDAPTRCDGRLLSIAKAPQYLADEEWCASAPYAEDLRETYTEWAEKLDWLDPPP